jgi:hypothetical protein
MPLPALAGAAASSGNAGGMAEIAGGVVQAGRSNSGGIPGLLGSMGDPLNTGWGMLTNILTWAQNKKTREESKRQFDKSFAENQRQFGLEYALKEFSTRKQLELQEVKDMYDAAVATGGLKLQTAATRQNLETSAQEGMQKEKLFDWATEDREKETQAQKSYAKGIIQGLSGRF